MSKPQDLTRRRFCGIAAATVAVPLGLLTFSRRLDAMPDVLTEAARRTGKDTSEIRPFKVNVPEAQLTDLRRRITATRWPDLRGGPGCLKRLGYRQFVAQGGDWGNAVSEQMALQAPPELLGISTNMAATVPAEIAQALASGQAAPAIRSHGPGTGSRPSPRRGTTRG